MTDEVDSAGVADVFCQRSSSKDKLVVKLRLHKFGLATIVIFIYTSQFKHHQTLKQSLYSNLVESHTSLAIAPSTGAAAPFTVTATDLSHRIDISSRSPIFPLHTNYNQFHPAIDKIMASCSFLDLPYELRIMIYDYSGMLRKPPDYCHCYCKACQRSDEHKNHHYRTGLIRPIIEQPSVLVNTEEDVFNTWIARSNTYHRAQPKYVHAVDYKHWQESSDLHRQVKEHHKHLYDTYGGSEENRARPLPRLAAEPDLALVSRHIRAETLEIFYSKQTFNFLIMKLPDDVDNLKRWLLGLGSRALWLRRLVLVYGKKFICKKHRKYLREHLLGQGVQLRPDALTFRRPCGTLCCQSSGELAYESETYRYPGQW